MQGFPDGTEPVHREDSGYSEENGGGSVAAGWIIATVVDIFKAQMLKGVGHGIEGVVCSHETRRGGERFNAVAFISLSQFLMCMVQNI